MSIFSLRHRRVRFALACVLLVPGALAIALVGASAGLTPMKVDRQAYHWDDATVPDPYAASGDSHLHVAVAN